MCQPKCNVVWTRRYLNLYQYVKIESMLNVFWETNPLSAKFIKWSNTLKQIVSKLPTICLSVFDHFSGLALKGLITKFDLKPQEVL